MPKLGESLTEGTILKWWKQSGDQVKKEETLLEVSTDKVDSEIPSPVDGVLREIVSQENETVEINQVIARIESAGASAAAEEPAEKEEVSASEKMPSPGRKISAPEAEEPEEISARSEGRFYSPLVRNIARQENVSQSELDLLAGSGAGGRVTKKDILNYLEMRKAAAKAEPAARPAATERPGAVEGEARTTGAGQREMIIPMDAVRKRIAVHMRQSLDTSAHVYSVSECDMTRVMQIMYARRPEFERTEGFKLTVTPLVLYAVTKALLDFPRVNSSLEGNNIIEKRYINLGLAVAARRGLIVPVVKSAEEKSFRGLARSVNDLIVRTRENRLTVDDVQGATYSVTNYGIFGNIIGLPIINQPNVAILGLGAIKKRTVVIESEAGDSIAIRSMAYISMSYDHRVVDGELGGRFMQRLVEYLENFSGDIL
ncbi:MAG: dihydrolipoamide acetyltransferase family protein [Calditrichia bacterium]